MLMRKLIVLCTILIFGAFTVAQAQATKADNPPKTTTKEVVKTDVVKKDVQTPSPTPGATTANPQQTQMQRPQKWGPHAPEFDDPNYHAKLREWMQNYPDEYNAYIKAKENK